MKNFGLALIIFLIWSFFGLWLYSWVSPKTSDTATLNNLKAKEITSLENTPVIRDTLNKINDSEPVVLKLFKIDSTILASYTSGIIIKKNSKDVLIDPTIDYQYKIASYLTQQPNLSIEINALYSPNEDFETPNYGFQRGNTIKEKLISVGIPSEKIIIKPVIKEFNFSQENTYSNGISFSFVEEKDILTREIDTDITINRTVYPKFSNNGILINKDLQELLAHVKDILSREPSTKIEVIGHTDNVGNGIDNYRLGLEYARQVRWYLISKGKIDTKQIKASSKGEEEPIDTNASERGRVTNRRIEVIFTNE
jgi:OOP family OmpA-OmpF porin